jgi:proteic killer suppression protein
MFTRAQGNQPLIRVDACIVARYNMHMIKTFQHKGLRVFFETGSMAGIQAAHAPKLGAILRRLTEATSERDMNLPGWKLHALKGAHLKGHFSVWVNGNWRLTFKFDGTDAILVDYQDYH